MLVNKSFISQEGVGDLYIRNMIADKDIYFQSDDGNGGEANYFYLDGSSATHDGSATTALYTNWPDKSYISLGTGHDLQLYHDGSNSFVDQTGAGHLYIRNTVNDADIVFQTDNGLNGITAYLTLDGGDHFAKFDVDTKIQGTTFSKTSSTTASGDATITHVADVRIIAGLLVSGTGIPLGASILSITDSTHFEMTANATATASGSITITFSHSGSLLISTAAPVIGDGHIIGRIDFQTPSESSGTDAILIGATIHAEADETFAADNNSTGLVFSTGTTTAPIERMRINQDGKVGIGTSAPTDNLSIEGAGEVSLSLYSTDTGSAGDDETFIKFYGENTSAAKKLQAQISASPGHDATNAGQLRFFTNDSSSALQERMIIRQDGFVGIGTSAPGTFLQLTNTAPYLTLKNSTAENINHGCESKIIFEDHGNNALGGIQISHEGTADDEKGEMFFQVNNDSGLQDVISINSSLNTTFAGDLAVNGEQFVITSSNDQKPLIHIKDTTNSVLSGMFKFTKDRGAAGTDAGDLGVIRFDGDNDAQQITQFVSILAEIQDATDGEESGKLTLNVASHDGGMASGLYMVGGSLDDEVDVTIANGAASNTTIAGDLNISGDALRFTNDAASAFISGYDTLIIGSDADDDDGGDKPIFFYQNGSEVAAVHLIEFTTKVPISITSVTAGAIGGGFDGAQTATVQIGEVNQEIITTIQVDLGNAGAAVNLLSSTTAGDVIGEDGVAAAFITRYDSTKNGVLYKAELICLETPVGGVTDINLTLNAASLAEDAAGEAEGNVIIDGGVQAIGKRTESTASVIQTAAGAHNLYIYLTVGAGGTAGTYSAGKFLIRMYGALATL